MIIELGKYNEARELLIWLQAWIWKWYRSEWWNTRWNLDAELKKLDVWVESEGVWKLQRVSGKMEHDARIGKQSFMSHNQGSGCVKKDWFCTREINAILGLCEVFRMFHPSWVRSQKLMWTCLAQLWLQMPWNSLWLHVWKCHRRGKDCYQANIDIPGASVYHLCWALTKGGKWVPWIQRYCWARIVLLLRQRTLARFVVWLGCIGLGFGLVSGGFGCVGLLGNFSVSFPVSCIDSLNKFPKAGKRIGLVVVDHIIFDMFSKSIASLSSECCISPLNSWLAAEI